MNMTKMAGFKKLALSIMLLCGVSTASAQTVYTDIGLPSAGSTDLILSVWDPTSQTSMAIDLGENISQFATDASGTITYNLDSTFQSWVNTASNGNTANGPLGAAGDNLVFNLAASTTASNGHSAGNQSEALVSYLYGTTNTFGADLNATNLGGWVGAIQGYIGTISTAPGASELVASSSQTYFNSPEASWGIGEGTIKTTGTLSTTTTSLSTFNASNPQSLNALSATILQNPIIGTIKPNTVDIQTLFTGYFSLNTANDTLVWTPAATSAVPVPGAVWLFLGGLMTMLGFRKNKTA
jgi:hypothetical protein